MIGTTPTRMNAGRWHTASGMMASTPAFRAFFSTCSQACRRICSAWTRNICATPSPEFTARETSVAISCHPGSSANSAHARASLTPTATLELTRVRSAAHTPVMASATSAVARRSGTPASNAPASRVRTSGSVAMRCSMRRRYDVVSSFPAPIIAPAPTTTATTLLIHIGSSATRNTSAPVSTPTPTRTDLAGAPRTGSAQCGTERLAARCTRLDGLGAIPT